MTTLGAGLCDYRWKSHGCDLIPGHDGPHQCGTNDPDGLCSQYDEGTRQAREYVMDSSLHWGIWHGLI